MKKVDAIIIMVVAASSFTETRIAVIAAIAIIAI